MFVAKWSNLGAEPLSARPHLAWQIPICELREQSESTWWIGSSTPPLEWTNKSAFVETQEDSDNTGSEH